MCFCMWLRETMHNIVVLFAFPVWNNILKILLIPKNKLAFPRQETLSGCWCWETVSESKHLYSIEVLRGFYSTSQSVISPAGVHHAIGSLYYVEKRVVLYTEVTQFVFVYLWQSFKTVWRLQTWCILNVYFSVGQRCWWLWVWDQLSHSKTPVLYLFCIHSQAA